MSNLIMVFDDISKNSAKMAASPSGAIFEENIKGCLKKYGFSEVSKKAIDDDLAKFLASIKRDILQKDYTKLCENSLYKSNPTRKDYANFYIWQPHGSQNFPDFLVFCEEYIFAIETKFSKEKQAKPMWNSNIPKQNSIYIFANHEFLDLTFFLGHDVIGDDERAELLAFWDETDKEHEKWEKEFIKKLKSKSVTNDYGFNTYVRKAYDQNKSLNENAILDFFKNPKRVDLENSVIEFIKKYS